MANANATSVSVSWNGSVLPALPLSGVVLAKNATLEDVTPYGTGAQVFANAGLEKRPVIKVVLLYDDTATTGEDALFASAVGSSAILLITWDAHPKTSSMTAFVDSYERNGTVGKMTKATVGFQPSGVITEV